MKLLNQAMIPVALMILQFSAASPLLAEANRPVAGNTLQSKKNIVISTGKSIKIEVKDATLYDTLKAITKESKVEFEVTKELLKNKISVQVDSSDWPGALKKLLHNYNYANSWRGDKLVKIFVFERGSGKSIDLRPPVVVDSPFPEPKDLPPPSPGSTEEAGDFAGGMFAPELPGLPPSPAAEGEEMILIDAGPDELFYPESLEGPGQEQTGENETGDGPEGPPVSDNNSPALDVPTGTAPK